MLNIYNKQNKGKEDKNRKRKRNETRTYTSKQQSSLAWFWPFPLVNLFTIKQKMINKLETRRSRLEGPQSKKYWLDDVLWKTPSLIHYPIEYDVFPLDFLCVLKSYYVWPFIVQKWGFGMALWWCEIHSKTQTLMQKTCLS